MKDVYLDHAATTPLLPEVFSRMVPFLRERYGNPSSIYRLGREARQAVEEARREVASLIGSSPEEVVFTSGGTEADGLAVLGTALANMDEKRHLLVSSIEHHAVLNSARFLSGLGFEVGYLRVDSSGQVDPEEVRKSIRKETFLVSVMHANNEVGTIQPVEEIGRICKEVGVLFHTDAVQSVGSLPVSVDDIGADLLSTSAHKIYGPKGAGALYVKKGTRIEGLLQGGEQERGLRAGTENVAGIAGFGAAAAAAKRDMDEISERVSALRDRLIEGILSSVEGAFLTGSRSMRLPNNAHFCFAGVDGEALCLQLDSLGVCAATGSACTSETLEPSHVLLAMGIEEEDAMGSVRFSLGRGNTEEDIEYVIEVLPEIIERLRCY